MKLKIKLPIYTVPARKEKKYYPTQYSSNSKQLSLIPGITIVVLLVTVGVITALVAGTITLPEGLKNVLAWNKSGVASFVENQPIVIQKNNGTSCKLNHISKPGSKFITKSLESTTPEHWYEFDSSCQNKNETVVRTNVSTLNNQLDSNATSKQTVLKKAQYYSVFIYSYSQLSEEGYDLVKYFPSLFSTKESSSVFFDVSQVNSTLLIENNQYYLQNNCFTSENDGCEVYKLNKLTGQVDLLFFDPSSTQVQLSQTKDTENLILLKTEANGMFNLILINLQNPNLVNTLQVSKGDAIYSKYFSL
jgi:hypothetical protein